MMRFVYILVFIMSVNIGASEEHKNNPSYDRKRSLSRKKYQELHQGWQKLIAFYDNLPAEIRQEFEQKIFKNQKKRQQNNTQ